MYTTRPKTLLFDTYLLSKATKSNIAFLHLQIQPSTPLPTDGGQGHSTGEANQECRAARYVTAEPSHNSQVHMVLQNPTWWRFTCNFRERILNTVAFSCRILNNPNARRDRTETPKTLRKNTADISIPSNTDQGRLKAAHGIHHSHSDF